MAISVNQSSGWDELLDSLGIHLWATVGSHIADVRSEPVATFVEGGCGGLCAVNGVLYVGGHPNILSFNTNKVTDLGITVTCRDLQYSNGTLWGVDTQKSRIVALSDQATKYWQPSFVSDEAADYCHLNGLACDQNGPKYATICSETASLGGWRDHMDSGGAVVDISTGEKVISGLSMPHSPRVINGVIHVCDSGHGTVVNPDGVVATLGGFTRGLAAYGDYLFVGISHARPWVVDKQTVLSQIVALDAKGDQAANIVFAGGDREIMALEVTS